MEYEKKIYEKLINVLDEKKIKVLSGLNVTDNKSLFLKLKDHLLANGIKEENILFKDYKESFFSIKPTSKVFFEDIKDYIRGKGKCYLFLFNVDDIEDYDKVLNSLIMGYNAEIYIATNRKLEGNYLDINVLPSSNIDCKLSFLEAMNSYRILNRDLFYNVSKYIFENIGKTFSIYELCTYLKKKKIKVNIEGVYNYVKCLEDSYIVYPCYRYDLKKHEKLKTLYKFYFSSLDFYNLILTYDNKIFLENKLFIEYMKNDFKVYSGKYGNIAIPFVLRDDKKIRLVSIDNEPDLSKIRGEYDFLNVDRNKLF